MKAVEISKKFWNKNGSTIKRIAGVAGITTCSIALGSICGVGITIGAILQALDRVKDVDPELFIRLSEVLDAIVKKF